MLSHLGVEHLSKQTWVGEKENMKLQPGSNESHRPKLGLARFAAEVIGGALI